MDEDDFEFILNAIEFIAMYGQRFLPLYSFNFRDGSWRIKTSKLESLIKEKKSYFRETRKKIISCFKKGNVGTKHAGMLKRESYLRAKCIANRVPKFPSQTILHEDINPSILHFVV